MDFLSVMLILFLILVAAIMAATGITAYENAKKIARLRHEVIGYRMDSRNHFHTYDALFRAADNRLRTIETTIEEHKDRTEDDRK